MKMLLATLPWMIFLAFLSACNSTLYYRGEQGSPVFVYVDETQKLIDADKSYCNVREYEFSLHHVGPVQGSERIEKINY